jgi:hypothetical protein
MAGIMVQVRGMRSAETGSAGLVAGIPFGTTSYRHLHFWYFCVYWKHTGGIDVRVFLEMPIL